MLVGEVFARMGLDSKQYEKDLSRLEGVTRREATTLGSIFKNAFSVALGIGVFEAVKRGFQTITGTAISFNAQMEQARIGFTTMLGSAERAEAFLSDMAEFAAKTPFEFQELLDASKRMLAYGFAAEDVLPTMEAVGNASAALGLGAEGINRIILALGQMRAKGKLSGEEMRQLTEAGIPAWEMLAEAMGKTTTEIMDMQSKGLIPADRAIKMLVEGMNKRFPNMMAQMEDTWEGVTSTIKDVWQMTIGAVTSGLFNGLKTWLQGVRDFATNFYNTFRRYGLQMAISESFGPEVAALINGLSAIMRGFGAIVRVVTGVITQYGKQIKFVAIVMGTYLALTKAVTLAKQVMIAVTAAESGQLLAKIPVLNVVSTAMGIYRVQMALAAQQGIVLSGVLAKLRVVLFSFWSALGPLGWAILAISAAVGVGTHLWSKYAQSIQLTTQSAKSFRELEESTKGAATATEEQADALEEAGKAAGKNLQSFDEVHQLQEDMAGSAEDMLDGLDMEGLDTSIPGLDVNEMLAGLEEGLETAKPTLAGFWEWIKQGLGNVWEGVKEKWNGFWGWVQSWGIWAWFSERWEGIKNFVGGIWEGVKEKWTSFWEWVKSWGLWQWLADRWDGLKEWAGNVWDGVKERWKSFKSWVASWAGPLWDGIKEKWAGFKEWAANMWDGAKEKWGQFTDWVAEKWSNFWTKAGEIWDGIKTTVQSKWEDLKTNAPIIWEDIKTNIQTRWDNLKTGASEAWSNIRTTIGTKWDELKTNAPIVWENIKKNVADRWDTLKTEAPNTWENIKKNISDRWEALKTDAPVLWENIRKNISEKWENLKTNAPTTWEKIKTEISTRWDALKTDAPLTWESIRKTISDKWDELKTNVGPTWTSIKTTIAEKWEEIKEDAFNWGKNLIDSFIDGIKNRFEALKSGVLSIGTAIKEALLGEGSKSSGGAGSKGGGGSGGGSTLADQAQASKDYYAANKEAIDKIAREKGVDLGVAADMLKFGAVPKMATGTNYVPRDMLAFLHEGEAVVPKAYNPAAGGGLTAEQVEQAVYRAFVSAMRIVQASSQQDDNREIVLKIDNTVLARMQLPALSREAQRQGVDLIIRPQGV